MKRFPSRRAPAHEIIAMTESVAVNILDMFCKNQLDVDKHLSNSSGFPKCEGGVLASGGTRRNTGRDASQSPGTITT